MALGYSVAVRNAKADAITTAADAGTAAIIQIYDSTGTGRPATGGAVTTQVLLATLTMSATSFAAASSGTIVGASITDDSSADATGTATWFRMLTQSAGTHIMDGDVGTSGSDLNLNTVSLVSGATVSITQFDITVGNA